MRDRLKVFAIDIIRGSVRSKSRRPMYALIRMEGGVIDSESEVSMFRLFRLLASEQPDILAVDISWSSVFFQLPPASNPFPLPRTRRISSRWV
jgi:hypothetical protein